MVLIAYAGLLILLFLAIFQLLLIFGAPLGKYAWGGKYTILPKKLRIASVVSIILYVIFTAFLVSKAGIANLISHQPLLDIGMWVLVGYFVLGIVLNAISRSKKERLVMTPVAVLLAVIFFFVALYGQGQQLTSSASAAPAFSFDTQKAPGWWTPGNYNASADEAAPIASITAFQGEKGATTNSCFVMAFYQKGDIDAASELQARKDGLVIGDAKATIEMLGASQQTMQTPEGLKEYTLHQFNLLTASQVQKGNEFGFIKLSDSYIELRGICPTGDMLAATVPALNALSLKP